MLAPATAITRAKSPEAFRTISEVSLELDVPQHVLRFWESRFAQIRPVKRAGGRRYYRPEDVDLLRGIRALLYSDGFTIRGVQKILRERGQRHVALIGRSSSMVSGDETSLGAKTETQAFAASGAFEARSSIASLERDDAEPEPRCTLEEEERVRLELLLAELLHLKVRLRRAAGHR